MPDLPPSEPDDTLAPPRPEGGVATRVATAVSSEGFGVDPDEPGVRYGWLRLAGLLGVLAFVGYVRPQMLLVILALVLMITLHELGHYLMAKRAGMKVTEFFLGFGPKIWSVRRGETEYGVKVIPAGAYVKIPGMVNIDEVPPEDEARTYRQKGFGDRVGVAVAGSAMHFMLALVLLYVSAVFIGQPAGAFSTDPPSPPAIIEKVHPGSGADEAGLQPGDRIRTVDGTATPTSASLRTASAPHYGETVPVTYVRDGRVATVPVTLGPYAFTLDDGSLFRTCGMGITMAEPQREKVGPIEGLVQAPQDFGRIFVVSVQGLGKLFSPSGITSFGSQVGNARENRAEVKQEKADTSETCKEKAAAIAKDPNGGSTASSSGGGENRILSIVGLVQVGSNAELASLVTLFALVNIFIGIFNLVPLLPFDGGHVAIAVYENIQEKRLHRRRYFADVTRLLPLTYGVVLVLGLLFVSSLYLDVVNPIG